MRPPSDVDTQPPDVNGPRADNLSEALSCQGAPGYEADYLHLARGDVVFRVHNNGFAVTEPLGQPMLGVGAYLYDDRSLDLGGPSPFSDFVPTLSDHHGRLFLPIFLVPVLRHA